MRIAFKALHGRIDLPMRQEAAQGAAASGVILVRSRKIEWRFPLPAGVALLPCRAAIKAHSRSDGRTENPRPSVSPGCACWACKCIAPLRSVVRIAVIPAQRRNQSQPCFLRTGRTRFYGSDATSEHLHRCRLRPNHRPSECPLGHRVPVGLWDRGEGPNYICRQPDRYEVLAAELGERALEIPTASFSWHKVRAV